MSRATVSRDNVTMTVRAQVRPELLAWARERSGLPIEDLTQCFPRLEDFGRGVKSCIAALVEVAFDSGMLARPDTEAGHPTRRIV
jgi:hypothetical protein